MKVRYFKDLSISHWSGGTTTQFLIFPENTNYADRNFLFRISSATIEEEQSKFTSLEAYERILMVLEGNVELLHQTEEDTIKVTLSRFEQTRFPGKWKTESIGKITDFNVIFNPSLQAELQVLSNDKAGTMKDEYLFIWSMEGKVTLDDHVITEGSFGYGFSKSFSGLNVEGRACIVRLKGELLQTI